MVLAWYTWAAWGDIQVDCGRELYVPTEILRGKLIYRDIFYQYGPLAPYICALLLSLFGAHLVVFYLFGIVVAIGCAILLFELGAMLEGRAAGLTAALALLFMGFAPGLANYVLPYSYAATIGLLLSLVCALFALRHLLDLPGYNLTLAGLAAGLALLCKQEFGAACYAMLAFMLVVETVQQRRMRPLFRGTAACAPGVALWLAIYGWFFWTLTPTYMLDSNWIQVPGTYYSRLLGPHFYAVAGQRFIPREMIVLTTCAALSLMLWFLLAKASASARNVVIAILIAIALSHRFGPLDSATRAVTVFLAFPAGMFFLGCGFFAYAIYKLNQSAEPRNQGAAAFGVFALVPASRVSAAIATQGYSIYYAIPLFLVFVIAISRCIKAAARTLPLDRQRGLLSYLLAAEVVILALICIPLPTQRTAVLETSWGAIRLRPEEANVAHEILAFISEQKSQGRKVAVLPEAPIFYALTGTEAPSRWYTLLPGFLSPSQEEIYIADLNRAAPDYILLTGRSTYEYGADYFGIDYDQKIYGWIESNYRVAGEFGNFRRDEIKLPLAALLYERNDLRHGS